MFSVAGLIVNLYRFFATRKAALALLALAFSGFWTYQSYRAKYVDDIKALIPDRHAQEFSLLSHSPLSKKIIIFVEAPQGGDTQELKDGVDRLVKALDPKLFTNVLSGPGPAGGFAALEFMRNNLPRLAGEKDIELIDARTSPEEVERRIKEAYLTMVSPAGWAMKGMVREDPLRLWEIPVTRLTSLNMLGKFNPGEAYFLSPDQQSALVIAETPVSVTNPVEARNLLNAFIKAREEAKLGGVTADMLSAHRYTLANAETIKGDIKLILGLSSLAIVAMFAWWLKRLDSIFVFLIPTVGVFVSAGLTAWWYGELNAITIGFGGVLLGIGVDYGVHVYYALRRYRDRVEALNEVTLPNFYAALTTLAGFGMLFFSELPGQRQLAFLSVVGVTLCLLAALILLPHFLKTGGEVPSGPNLPLNASASAGRFVMPLWILWMVFFGWQCFGMSFEGNLKNVGVVPPDVKRAEERLAQKWGAFRDRALVFVEGSTFDEASARSGELNRLLAQKFGQGEVRSLSPVLPSLGEQEASLKRWREFWTPQKIVSLKAQIDHTAGGLGFAPQAFDPFFAYLAAAPSPITPQTLENAGLSQITSSMLFKEGDKFVQITLVPDKAEYLEAVKAAGFDTFVSPGGFSQGLGMTIAKDFTRFLALSLALVVVLTYLATKTPRRLVAGLIPVVTGLVTLIGVSGLLGIKFNLFNIMGAVLVIGLNVDYGLYMVMVNLSKGVAHNHRAVVMCGLTTLAGLGALIFASHPSLYSLGLTVFFGVGSGIPAAIWVTPLVSDGGDGLRTQGHGEGRMV